MSFSGMVKDELSQQTPPARHCQLAELMAILAFGGRLIGKGGSGRHIRLQTENPAVIRKCFTLLKKTFNIEADVAVRLHKTQQKNRSYLLIVSGQEAVDELLLAIKAVEDKELPPVEIGINGLLVQRSCCRRAFVRGAFLASGSISAPEKFYHFEIVCQSMEKADKLRELICSFEIDAKIVHRKKYYVVYIKEGAQIVDMLNIMEAHISLMELENLRIIKEMRNSVNRRVNCETANINKTVSAAVKQLSDITFIKDHMGLDKLSDNLREMAELRLDNPDATLKELGEMLTPTVGKSGVNHRLRKLSELADKLKEQKEELL